MYAFFTFNSISFNWEESFSLNKASSSEASAGSQFSKEEDQIKSYVTFADSQLHPDAATLLTDQFAAIVKEFGIKRPVESMRSIELVNPVKGLRSQAKAMPALTEKLINKKLQPKDLYATLAHMLHFVYLVRCNIFHGVKTQVEMTTPDQQQRLLVYTALLIAASELLFQAARRANIGWQDVEIDFSNTDTQPSAARDAR